MKKAISLIMSLCLVLSAVTVGSLASDAPTNIFYYENNKEIQIYDDGIELDKMQYIADYIAGANENDVNSETTPYGILCIFGHSLKTTYATETTHNVYSTSPKCVENTYKVEYCTRSSCDYISKELVDSYRTSACHG